METAIYENGSWKHSKVCYVLERTPNGNKFVPVKHAKTFANDYGLDLFLLTKDVYFEEEGRLLYNAGSLIDGMTGLKLCEMEQLSDCINARGLEAVQNLITSLVKQYGWSPRYLNPDEKKSEVFKKDEKEDDDKCVMATPVFHDGMFNRSGKRMRVKFVKTVSCDSGSYDLYISGSKTPENDYPMSDDDKYYLYVMLSGWLIPLNMTECYLRKHAVRKAATIQMYGDEMARAAFYGNLRKDRSFAESEPLVNEQLKKEEALEKELEKDDRYMAEAIKLELDRHVQNYVACKNGNGTFPDFIGAVIMNEVDNCTRLSEIRKRKNAEEQEIRKKEAEEAARKQHEEEAARMKAELESAEDIMVNGGVITDGKIICKLAEKYGVSIPLRTKGWILNSFAQCKISGSSISVRYWKTKNGNGSTKIYDIISDIMYAVRKA